MFKPNINPMNTTAIHTADISKFNGTHIGDISITSLYLSDTYLVPKLSLNLISISQLCELGYGVYFSEYGLLYRNLERGK